MKCINLINLYRGPFTIARSSASVYSKLFTIQNYTKVYTKVYIKVDCRGGQGNFSNVTIGYSSRYLVHSIHVQVTAREVHRVVDWCM